MAERQRDETTFGIEREQLEDDDDIRCDDCHAFEPLDCDCWCHYEVKERERQIMMLALDASLAAAREVLG